MQAGNLPNFWTCRSCGRPAVMKAEPEVEVVDTDQPEDVILPENLTEKDAEAITLDFPDFLEVEIGWRAWKLDPARLPGLASVSHKEAVWTPGEAMAAVCTKTHHVSGNKMVPVEGDIPGKRCSCGLYAARNYGHLRSMGYHRYDARGFTIVGKVKLWGRVVPGTQGWRSEFAYPERLYLPFEAHKYAKPLAEAWMVPVKLRNFLKGE